MSDDDNQNLTHRGRGRPAGSLNKFSERLKHCMIYGAEESDLAKDKDHPELPGSLEIYMKNLANLFPLQYYKQLARLCPAEVHTQISETSLQISYSNMDDVRSALLASGLTHAHLKQLEKLLPDTSYQHQRNDDEETSE
jgi:hypothetical protein